MRWHRKGDKSSADDTWRSKPTGKKSGGKKGGKKR